MMIKILKNAIANFMTMNPQFDFDGIDIETIAKQDQGSVGNFITNVVRKLGVDARSIILAIAPIILRISINVLVLDLLDKESVLFFFILIKYYFFPWFLG